MHLPIQRIAPRHLERDPEAPPGALHAFGLLLSALLAVLPLTVAARASTAYGSLNNFDCVNDTGSECHGFEIELEDIQSRDISYTYNWNHYGTPQITEDNSNPLHPKVIVRYASAKNPDGTWAAYTAIPSGPIAPTDGHQFTNPAVNFGGEHFGVGFYGAATNINYHWLVDNGSGVLVRGPAVIVSTPTFVYAPPAGGQPARVQAAIEPAPPEEVPVREFGEPSWVKEIRTTSHNPGKVPLRDLVSDDPDDPADRNWRNGEPDEVEVEWQLLQTEFRKADGGRNGRLEAKAEDLPGGDEVVTRRYEFYKYVGPIDAETGEAMAESVGADGVHGTGVKVINDVEVDLSSVIVVGDFAGSQMSAFDPETLVGLIDHVQDGEAEVPYPTRTLVIAGETPFTATNWGNLPPGLAFDPVTGELSGTPSAAGVYQFTVQAQGGTNAPVRKNYTLTVAEPGQVLPPRYLVDTLSDPLDAGATQGDGAYANGTTATVTALPAAGFAFLNWTDNGRVVSEAASYAFTNVVNRALVAHFGPAGPLLSIAQVQADTLRLSWPGEPADWKLQEGADLAHWTDSGRQITVVNGRNEVAVTPLAGAGFFRLIRR